MLVLITGGSGSGKSAWAEDLACTLGPGSKYYLATMRPFGQDAAQRIKRHHQMRSGKGFYTIECPDGLFDLPIGPADTVLLEDLSNLAANLRFSDNAQDDCFSVLWAQLSTLANTCKHFIVVSNEIFSDGVIYERDIMDYLALLGRLNEALAEQADLVVEVVCGLPLPLKGAVPCSMP